MCISARKFPLFNVYRGYSRRISITVSQKYEGNGFVGESHFVMLSDQGFLTNIGTQLTMKRVLQTTSLGMVRASSSIFSPPGRLLQENGGRIAFLPRSLFRLAWEHLRSSAASRMNRSESKLVKNIRTTCSEQRITKQGKLFRSVSVYVLYVLRETHLEISLFCNACTCPLVSKLCQYDAAITFRC